MSIVASVTVDKNKSKPNIFEIKYNKQNDFEKNFQNHWWFTLQYTNCETFEM